MLIGRISISTRTSTRVSDKIENSQILAKIPIYDA